MADCRRLVTDEICRLFDHRSDHREVLYRLILDYPLREGKALRPTLAIAMCRALGGDVEAVLPTAATLELYHNAFLVHDDVEDDSLMRRGGPTLHVEHGVPIAINVGDAMFCLSLKPLLDNVEVVGLGPALRILETVAHMTRESVEGQAIELDWIRHNRWDLDDAGYADMVVQKTGWYSFIVPMQVGAIAAGAAQEQVDKLVAFGRELSVAFQITDDLLNVRADPEEYGKEIGGDLWEGKRTLILLHAVRTTDASERERAVHILSQPRPPSDRVARVRDLLDNLVTLDELTSGGRARARAGGMGRGGHGEDVGRCAVVVRPRRAPGLDRLRERRRPPPCRRRLGTIGTARLAGAVAPPRRDRRSRAVRARAQSMTVVAGDESHRPRPDPRVLGLLVAELERLRTAAMRAVGPSPLVDRPPALPDDLTADERRLVEILHRARRAVVEQPALAHAITSFLVGEGRRYAETDEGRRWLDALRDAPEVERLRRIWEATTLNVLDDQHLERGVPPAWVDLITDLTATGRVESIVTALRPEGLA